MATTHNKRPRLVSIGRLSAWIVGLTGLCLSLAAWSGLTVRSTAANPIASQPTGQVQLALHAD